MRHHFGDMLDRDDGHWTIVPNRERYAYRIGDVPAGSKEITVVTVGAEDEHWERVLTLPNLEELTLHAPSLEQLHAIRELPSVRRLRITHVRPPDVDFLKSMPAVEELVLEYVSGFSDLAPLRSLSRLRALHLENLRRVTSFAGLAGLTGLKYLAIYGTTDWKQPIEDFEFLGGLPNLEVLALWQVINKTPYPALVPATRLKSLKRIRLHGSYLATEEYALLEAGLAGVEGAKWGPHRVTPYAFIEVPRDDVRSRLPEDVLRANHPEVRIHHDGKRMIADPKSEWIEFTGKGAGRVKPTSANAEVKCRDAADRYAAMLARARAILAERPPA